MTPPRYHMKCPLNQLYNFPAQGHVVIILVLIQDFFLDQTLIERVSFLILRELGIRVESTYGLLVLVFNCFKIIKNYLNYIQLIWVSSWNCNWKLLIFTTSILSCFYIKRNLTCEVKQCFTVSPSLYVVRTDFPKSGAHRQRGIFLCHFIEPYITTVLNES